MTEDPKKKLYQLNQLIGNLCSEISHVSIQTEILIMEFQRSERLFQEFKKPLTLGDELSSLLFESSNTYEIEQSLMQKWVNAMKIITQINTDIKKLRASHSLKRRFENLLHENTAIERNQLCTSLNSETSSRTLKEIKAQPLSNGNPFKPELKQVQTCKSKIQHSTQEITDKTIHHERPNNFKNIKEIIPFPQDSKIERNNICAICNQRVKNLNSHLKLCHSKEAVFNKGDLRLTENLRLECTNSSEANLAMQEQKYDRESIHPLQPRNTDISETSVTNFDEDKESPHEHELFVSDVGFEASNFMNNNRDTSSDCSVDISNEFGEFSKFSTKDQDLKLGIMKFRDCKDLIGSNVDSVTIPTCSGKVELTRKSGFFNCPNCTFRSSSSYLMIAHFQKHSIH